MHRAPIHVAATGLCLLCALFAGGTCAIAALAQTTHAQARALALAQAHGSAKQGHATKRSVCARQKRRHAKGAKRCRSRHAPAKPKPKLLTPAPLTPAALLSVPPAVAPTPTPIASPIASSPAPATTPGEAPPSEEAPSEVEPPSVPHVQVSAIEYGFSLSRTTVPAGKVIVQFVNDGQDEHNLKLTDGSEGPLAGSFADTPAKGVAQLQLEMHTGEYTLFCSLQGHEAKGMKATLTVE